jgi:hypothetical protein
MDKQLSKLTTTEIKAMLYDQIIISERANNNIRILRQELDSRPMTPGNIPQAPKEENKDNTPNQ